MSIAAGRAWMAAGQGLNNLGALLLQQQEMERERDRQKAEDDRRAFESDRQKAEDDRRAFERQRADYVFQRESGVTFVPPGGALPNTGTATGTSGKTLLAMPPLAQSPDMPRVGLAPMGFGPQAAPQPAKPPLSALSRIVGGSPATAGPAGAFVQTGRTADEREQDAKMKADAATADVIARGDPDFAARPWREQVQAVGTPTIYNAITAQGNRAAATARATAEAARDAAVAQSHLNAPYWGNRPKNLGVEATNIIGLQLAARGNAGSAGTTGDRSGPAAALTPAQARDALASIRPQTNETRRDLAATRQRLPWNLVRPVAKEGGPPVSPAAEAAFTRDWTLEGQQRGRLDSLTALSDTLTARAMGRPMPIGTPAALTPSPAQAPRRGAFDLGVSATPTAAQAAWDALPGTPEQKTARVGPRPR